MSTIRSQFVDDGSPTMEPSHADFALSHAQLAISIDIPPELVPHATSSTHAFLEWLPSATCDEILPEPNSHQELFACFLGFLSKEYQPSNVPLDRKHLLQSLISNFDSQYRNEEDIHIIASELPCSEESRRMVIRSYYAAREVAEVGYGSQISTHRLPSLFRAKGEGHRQTVVAMVFGGQGNTEDYLEELRITCTTYAPFLRGLVSKAADVLASLAKDPEVAYLYPQGLDFMSWLNDEVPHKQYLLSSPVSFPLIGLLQLCNFCVACHVMEVTPGEFLRRLEGGAAGHSQGVIVAAALAACETWLDFERAVVAALTILFYVGSRSQQMCPQNQTPAYHNDESDFEMQTPMLSVRHLSESFLQQIIDDVNLCLAEDKQVSLAIVNQPQHYVLSGPAMSLQGLRARLSHLTTSPETDQSRILFSQRKPQPLLRYLPVTVAFHNKSLESAVPYIMGDLHRNAIRIETARLKIPVSHSRTGENLQNFDDDDLVLALVRMITTDKNDWPLATNFQGATHVIEFGPGGIAGVGTLLQRNKEGTGVRIILGGVLSGVSDHLGYQTELFGRVLPPVFGMNWKDLTPGVIRDISGKVILDTKLSRVLGLAPIIIGGMTPTTTHPEFVAAAANAGYHAELAGGGYLDADHLTQAIAKLQTMIRLGTGITINLIYSNPKAIQWQIPLIKDLIRRGESIDGLAFGAGVPSLEVATDYIQSIGLKHIAFKPGSVDSIEQVVRIAISNPQFPVILQWTGGRGGGHHSFEDFHEPILQTYNSIRRCPNLILVAGSGFGGAEDTWPYFTGGWSQAFGRPPMPFDGCLLGSRMMVVKEAYTSKEVKIEIAKTGGVPDAGWQQSYAGTAGGIMTVKSEMGQPIHKIATRGVRLWSELDKTIFALEKPKQLTELKRKKSSIIRRLNNDFQKVWFGCDGAGLPVDIEDMTYIQILGRLIDLLYVKHKSRWIDDSYKPLVDSFAQRLEERFASTNTLAQGYLLPATSELFDLKALIKLADTHYPLASVQLISTEDEQFLVAACRARGTKPMPFILKLDDSFEYWFKKDSLWQSEDLDAVMDHDVQRTCILQGPVAASHTSMEDVDVPIRDVLDDISKSHILMVCKEQDIKSENDIPRVEYFGTMFQGTKSSEVQSDKERGAIVFKTAMSLDEALPNEDSWFHSLAGENKSWRQALFLSRRISQGSKLVDNPLRRIFAPRKNIVVKVSEPDHPPSTTICLDEPCTETASVLVSLGVEGRISLKMTTNATPQGQLVELVLEYTYQPDNPHCLIHESTKTRNDRIRNFYRQIWFNNVPDFNKFFDPTSCSSSRSFTTIKDSDIVGFSRAIGMNESEFTLKSGSHLKAPLDFGIVVAWESIMETLMVVDGDLLQLVHLSNQFKLMPSALALKSGDTISSIAQVTAITAQGSGKLVEICATISRDRVATMEIVSQFLFKGTQANDSTVFRRQAEPTYLLPVGSAVDYDILASKPWFFPTNPAPFIPKELTFRLQTSTSLRRPSHQDSVHVIGVVEARTSNPKVFEPVAKVEYTSSKTANSPVDNPVLRYLRHHGSIVATRVPLSTPINIGTPAQLLFTVPASNSEYARASQDYNPIHVSRCFAAIAGLPEPITHGMHTSAIVQRLCRQVAARNVEGKIRRFQASFTDIVCPGDELQVIITHVAMSDGLKVLNVKAMNTRSNITVLTGECEVEQPNTAYLFTGQGSQVPKMGMELFHSSEVARKIWDRADKYFFGTFGFRISEIVRENPKEMTVHFGGRNGAMIRQNYRKLTYERCSANGAMESRRFFEIHPHTSSHTFRCTKGLLFSTEFTQPALTIMQKAQFEDMLDRQLIPFDSKFAGHSLGEYSALSSIGNIVELEELLSIVFYRGLSMQVSVERDELGRSDFAMVAVDPSRVTHEFSTADLQHIVREIAEKSRSLLEIVNYNVEQQQYVCAGTLQSLQVLAEFLGIIHAKQKIPDSNEHVVETLLEEIKKQPKRIQLSRSKATIPLPGIDVPFHSSFLLPTLPAFRKILQQNISRESLDVGRLLGKYIPNVTAQPFDLSRESFELAYAATKSEKLKEVLDKWDTEYALQPESDSA